MKKLKQSGKGKILEVWINEQNGFDIYNNAYGDGSFIGRIIISLIIRMDTGSKSYKFWIKPCFYTKSKCNVFMQ